MMKSVVHMILLMILCSMATVYSRRSEANSVLRSKGDGVKVDLTVDVNGKRVIDVSHPKKNGPLRPYLEGRGNMKMLGFFIP